MGQVNNSSVSEATNLLVEFENFATNVKNDLVACVDSHLGDLKKQINAIVKKMNVMDSEIINLNDRVHKLESDIRSCDLIVSNIPALNNEIVSDIICKIGNVINFNCENHLFNAFRISGKGGQKDNKSGSIVIKFAMKSSAVEFFKLYRKKQSLSLNDIGIDSTSRVYINCGLPNRINQMFAEAKKLQKLGNICKVFIKSGSVYITESLTSDPVMLTNMQQLTAFVNGERDGRIILDQTSELNPLVDKNVRVLRKTRSKKLPAKS